MPTVLIASDKFKGSLTAAQVAGAVAEGVRRARPDVRVESVPVADGGDGTIAAALAAGFERVPVVASGPTGEPVRTGYARRADLAVVEMADVSGLTRLPGGVLAPLNATSRGVGEVMAAAIAAGCRTVVLGIGGSASTDGGAGLLGGLGALLLDAGGSPVADGGAGLTRIASVELGALRGLISGVRVILASDVDNPLTGPKGAAAVYGPQKGATPEQIRELDDALTHSPTSWPRPRAQTSAATPAPARRAEPDSPRSPYSTPSFGPASTWYSSWSASRTGSPRLISS